MHHDSDWNYVNRADQNRVPNLSRARFDYKRKDEDDMAKSTKTYEERIRALEKKEQESIEATKKLIAQRKELEKRKKAEESKVGTGFETNGNARFQGGISVLLYLEE